jgi:predicted nucleic acid-binding protein
MLEIGNALLTAERCGRISRKERDRCLQLLTAIQVAVDAPFPLAKLADLVKLASDHDLTTYDASYLLLARERGLALATVDQHMRKASAKLRIRVLP